jgi:hypothetical protein
VDGTIDLVFSMDTTGSTHSVALQARKRIKEAVAYLFPRIPELRVGAFFHGDWNDRPNLYTLDLTSDQRAITDFIESAPSTGGQNIGAMYEGIFHNARSLSWTSGRNKALVLLADTYPHVGGENDQPDTCGCGWNGRRGSNDHPRYNWRNELGLLNESNIAVYPVRLLAHYNREAAFFYKGVSAASNVPCLELEQFSDVSELIMALCMSRAGKLDEFSADVVKRSGGVSHVAPGVQQILASLGGKKFNRFAGVQSEYTQKGLVPVEPSRFQTLYVDRDISQEDFVAENGARYVKGRGFYEFTKSVILRPGREVLVQDRRTGAMFTGAQARKLLGLPLNNTSNIHVHPTDRTWRGFIQSTSPVRKLLKGTMFLYEASK